MLQGQDIYNDQDASRITVRRHAKKLTNPPASQGIEGGYAVDYRVHKTVATQAELKIDIESAGHWFGGGVVLAN